MGAVKEARFSGSRGECVRDFHEARDGRFLESPMLASDGCSCTWITYLSSTDILVISDVEVHHLEHRICFRGDAFCER
jgi:hypothetical protein